MLDTILSSKQFRTEMLLETFRDFVHQQQFYHWRHYRRDPLSDAEHAKQKQSTTVKTEADAAAAVDTDVSGNGPAG